MGRLRCVAGLEHAHAVPLGTGSTTRLTGTAVCATATEGTTSERQEVHLPLPFALEAALRQENQVVDSLSDWSYGPYLENSWHWLTGGNVTYTVATGTELATSLSTLRPGTPDGTTRVSQLGQLANQVYSTVDTKAESAAFQLAVWAITYGITEGGRYHINTTNTGFKVDSGTAASAYGLLADTWLQNLGSAGATGNYKLTYLNDGTA